MRQSISTRTRFEIFKRDSFTCQYCGKRPPATILHCDHILPVSRGGKNGHANLVTSCDKCNLGKSNVLLNQVPISLRDMAAKERVQMEQMMAYEAFLSEQSAVEDERFRLVSDKWISLSGGNSETTEIAGQRLLAVKQFLKRLAVPEIIEALEKAYSSQAPTERRRLKYFCKVCWNKINERAKGVQIEAIH